MDESALRHFNSSLSLSLLLFREDRERKGSPLGCIRRRPLTSVVRTLAFHAQHPRFLLYVTRSISRARWRATHANESRLCTLIDHYPARLPTFSSRRVHPECAKNAQGTWGRWKELRPSSARQQELEGLNRIVSVRFVDFLLRRFFLLRRRTKRRTRFEHRYVSIVKQDTYYAFQ